MRTIRITGTAVLATLLGITAPGFAGQEHPGDKQDHSRLQQDSHEQAHPQQRQAQRPQKQQSRPQERQAQQSRQQQSRPQQQQAQQSRQQRNNSQPQQAQQPRAQQQEQMQQTNRGQQRRAQQERGNGQFQRTTAQQSAQQSVWQQHRSGSWQSDHRTWQQRGGYNGYRIPDGRFRGYFGPSHRFRIRSLPFMIQGGYPRFQYGGYWLSLVDPWPSYWGDDWYDNDDVYVNYVNNGYYLYDRRYPGVGIAISISL